MSGIEVLGELLTWLCSILMVAAGGVCLIYRRLTPGLYLLAITFACQGVLSGVDHGLFLLMRRGMVPDENYALLSLFDATMDLLTSMLVIAGLIWILGDVKRKIYPAHGLNRSEPLTRSFPDDEGEDWKRPKRD